MAKEEDELRTKKKLTNDNLEPGMIQQNILVRNIDKAVAFFMANRDLFNYRTFRQIDGASSQIVNKLRGIDNSNLEAFYGIKTSVLSLLRPKVRIFKVIHEEFVETDGHQSQEVTALSSPCYKEFKFSDNFGIETALTPQDYLKYESSKPHWRNVGLKSLDFTYNGEADGPIQTDVACTITLAFKSLKDLQASPPGEPSPEKGGLRYVDLVTWAPASLGDGKDTYNPKHYEIKALVGYTQPSKEQLRALNLSERDINTLVNIEKMNIILSLNVDTYDFKIREDGMVELAINYRAGVESSMSSNQTNIYGNNFRIAGSDGLEISHKVNPDYNISNIYRLDASLSTIKAELVKPSCKSEKCKGIKLLKDLVKTDKVFAVLVKEAFADDGRLAADTGMQIDSKGALKIRGSGEALFKFFKDKNNINRMKAALRRKIGLYKKDIYKSFMEQLIDGNDEDLMAPGTRLFCINAGSSEVEDAMGAVTEARDIAKSKPGVEEVEAAEDSTSPTAKAAAASTKGDGDVKIDRCHLVSPIDPEIKSAVAQELTAALESQVIASAAGMTIEEAATILDSSEENYKFYFVFLGDIIELACKNAGVSKLDLKSPSTMRNLGHSVFTEESYFPKDEHNTSPGYPLKNKRILLGPIDYIDTQGRAKRINLAQFPVSFNVFRAWFMKKIVRPQRVQLSLNTFIRLLIRDLVIPCLGAQMPENYIAPNTRINITSLTLPGKQGKVDGIERKTCGRSLGKFKEALPMEQVIDIGSALFKESYLPSIRGISQESMLKTSHDYLLIYVASLTDTAERKGDLGQDTKDGIFHFNIGSDIGLLKSMTFRREQTPGLLDHRTTQALQGGDMAQFKFPYSTDLTLVGNTLFIPGMYYYVNPTLTGLGSPGDSTSLSHKMNLGGYHSVEQVRISISQDSFETTIDGRQLGIGKK